MDVALIGAVATIIAALVTLFGAIYVQRKTAEYDQLSKSIERKYLSNLTESERRHEKQLSILSSRLEEVIYKSNSIFSKKLEVIGRIYSMLGCIQFELESFLVGYTEHSESGNPQKLIDASKQFEELRKYYAMNLIYVDNEQELGQAIGKLMGDLNRMNVYQYEHKTATDPAWNKQVEVMQQSINPLLNSIKEQFKESLKLERKF